ncbi:MAG TPA: hypothetical protein PLR44_12220 [Thermomicrobiales bacterium]|nr:hypothetical protein [Thermomicrobiales bacterium]HRA32362.1 hypothetical protein [Thermomicrobiales bacterium]
MFLPIYHGGKLTWDEWLVLAAVMAAVPLLTWLWGRRNPTPDSPPTPPESDTPDDIAA